jgi:predicted DNA-binding transcriptional regulator AlpA
MAHTLVDDVLLNFAHLRERGVPFSRPHLRRLEKEGRFPKRLAIGEKRVAWWNSDLTAWLESKAV